jgi:phosphinothricin acetyltransferase
VTTVPVIRPATAADAARVAAIYNEGITSGLATFETRPRSAVEMTQRITSSERRPLLVAKLEGEVVGWAGIDEYRTRPCYAGVGEFSIYVAARVRGRGIGRALLAALVLEAERLGYWKLLSRVFPENAASRAIARACGFREVGVYEKHAKLGDRWLDTVIVERLIPSNQR